MTCQPQSVSCFTAPMMRGLSLSLTDTKTRPVVGKRLPQPSCAFATARLKLLSIPMTSPVDFISGASTGSGPGKRERTREGEGKGVSVRVDLGGGRNIKKK